MTFLYLLVFLALVFLILMPSTTVSLGHHFLLNSDPQILPVRLALNGSQHWLLIRSNGGTEKHGSLFQLNPTESDASRAEG